MKQCYLEQQLLASELEGVVQSHTQHPGAQCLAASRLQHCLTICPEQTILGVTTDHLRAVDPIREIKVTRSTRKESQLVLATFRNIKQILALVWRSD